MNQRDDLLDRIVRAQSELRGRFHTAVSPSLEAGGADLEGITLQQMAVVRRLLAGDEMTMHDVAAAQGIGPSGATQLVDRLERHGLVMRVRDLRDRRVQRVVPTERAAEVAQRIHAAVNETLAEILSVLDDDELRLYVDLTERVAAAWRHDAPRGERLESTGNERRGVA